MSFHHLCGFYFDIVPPVHLPLSPLASRQLPQVRLTEDLASAAARVSQLQLEASAHQQKAAELQGKLSTALQDGESRCQRVAALEAQLEGDCVLSLNTLFPIIIRNIIKNCAFL